MITNSLRILLIVGIILYFIALYRLLKKRRFILKYALLWIILGVCLLILTIVPGLLTMISGAIGIAVPVNALFFIMLAMLIIITLSITVICSGFSDKTRELIQQTAVLEKRIRDLEEKINTAQPSSADDDLKTTNLPNT